MSQEAKVVISFRPFQSSDGPAGWTVSEYDPPWLTVRGPSRDLAIEQFKEIVRARPRTTVEILEI